MAAPTPCREPGRQDLSAAASFQGPGHRNRRRRRGARVDAGRRRLRRSGETQARGDRPRRGEGLLQRGRGARKVRTARDHGMNRRCLPWLALLAMLPLGTGGILAQTVWQTVADPDGAFIIEMPGQPKHWTDERKSPRGATLMLHNYAVGYNGQI